MSTVNNDEIRQEVRKSYGHVATAKPASACCGGGDSSGSSCCGTPDPNTAAEISLSLGYSGEDVNTVPEGANMGLGCGNPHAIASLKRGETVLDLGSGGGFDCFVAARAVGPEGSVIGVDMTPEMIARARRNAEKSGLGNVDFRLGEIESLPVANETVDVILSNCVINLSPEKDRVFNEAFRVLKSGGRLAISDVVATAEAPEEIKKDIALYSSCISGAAHIAELESAMKAAGFQNIRIEPKEGSRELIRSWAPGRGIEDYVTSAIIEAVKP
jgi:SAM-dependent methyltransferase